MRTLAACPFCCCTVISYNKLPYSPWQNERMKTSYKDLTDSEIVVSDFACASCAPILICTQFLGRKNPGKGCTLDSRKYGIICLERTTINITNHSTRTTIWPRTSNKTEHYTGRGSVGTNTMRTIYKQGKNKLPVCKMQVYYMRS